MTIISNKLRGGYYTPSLASEFLTRWAIRSAGTTILEPSCGDGSILNAAASRLFDLGCSRQEIRAQLTGVELIPEEALKAEASGATVICDDFFSCCRNGLLATSYDAIVGNPPFIRYQDFREEYRETAFELMRSLGFSPNRLTNIWIPFIAVCCHLLTDNGRLAMVVPAELFQVNYAREIRDYLLGYFSSITLITFDSLLFDGAQQEVVLLLAERTKVPNACGVRVLEVADASDLRSFGANPDFSNLPVSDALPSGMKWQGYYLDPAVLKLLEETCELLSVQRLSDIADVNVGLVSGQNSFFVINEEEARRWDIRSECIPIVSRSLQLRGLKYGLKDMKTQERQGRRVLLFNPGDNPSDAALAYIAEGERLGFQNNYKCRIRRPWYCISTSWKSDAFFYRQVGSSPRIVVNEANSLNTDTLHKIRFKPGVDGRLAATCFNNSLTFAMGELLGRSYGGGVLTFEPSEARALPLPFIPSVKLDFEKADRLARDNQIDALLDYVDSALLVGGLGMSEDDVCRIRLAWKTLRDRRLGRRSR